MTEAIRIEAPGNFAPVHAVGYDDGTESLALVSPAQPLPVCTLAPATPAPLTGDADETTLAGPYVPVAGAPVVLALWGGWEGEVRLLRSTDGGATRLPVTLGGGEWGVFSGNACEPVWQESERGASLWLELAPTSGTVHFRVAQ